MSDFKLFYKLSRRDQNRNMVGAYIKKPEIIGVLETIGNQVVFAERMKYFEMPKGNMYPLDLNQGREKYKHRDTYAFKDKLNKIAFYIINNPDCIDEGVVKDYGFGEPTYEVVTHRGVLSILMETPYKYRPNGFKFNWNIFAIQYKNKLYLKLEKEDDFPRINNPNSTHHFKFEQFCFTDDPLRDPDTTAAIDESQQIYCIYRTKLKNINLMYSCESNGIISENKLHDLRDIQEVRQSRFVHTKLMKDNFPGWRKNYRVLSWWNKSYLAGVNDLYIGFKTEEDLIRKPVEHYLINKLPENQYWSPKVCNQFVYTFITKVLETMRGVDSPYTCYEFAFDSKEARIDFRTHTGKTEYSFLNDVFVKHLQNN